jgi:arylsulfatase A-like enzyme
MIRRLLLSVVFLAGCGLNHARFPARQGNARRAEKPNILFIFTDDHASHAIGAYGSRINQTPNIDRLAAGGMLFRNCFVTNSLCGPSRAVILTGKYSHLNGFYANELGDKFDGSQQTFPKLLQQAGYQTAIIGKWHLVTDPTGFDYWNILPAQGIYYNPPMNEMGRPVKHEGYVTDILTDLSLDWLKNKRDPGKPFMLMYQHKAPHREWEPGPKYLTRYQGRTIPEPSSLFDDYSGRGTAAHTQDMTIARTLREKQDLKIDWVPPSMTPEQKAAWVSAYKEENDLYKTADFTPEGLVRWKYQRYIKDYLRCVDSVDENIGRVLDYLEESGLAENTIVVYSSDNGFFLGEHGWFDKRWMYEESLRVPLIVRWPGVTRPGRTNKNFVSNLDFAETFLDAAGLPVPPDMQGRSLVPLLRGETPRDWRTSFYYHYYEYPGSHMVRQHEGVRTPRHKLIHYYTLDEWELFDLEKDPREMKSVYGDPAYSKVRRQLETELLHLRQQYKVPPPQDNP